MPGRAIDFLRAAERELERVVQISKQTLSFSRESAEPVPIQVAELMDEVVRIYSRRLAQRRLTVVREYASGETIVALPGEIRQVLSNLVTNAIEACAPGGKLRLRIRNTRQYGPERTRKGIRITVSDNGSGIPREARKRLGEMFFTTKGDSGTGLGLWVTHAIVARYGGTMRLRSTVAEGPGDKHGTTFTVFLPSSVSAAQADDAAEMPANSGNVREISSHPSHSTHQVHDLAGRAARADKRSEAATRQREG
jgi:signal transduction histidine kinase